MADAIVAEGLVKRFADTAAPAGVDLAVRTGPCSARAGLR
jgi:hypothetical protein